jgi:hypothetical protein
MTTGAPATDLRVVYVCSASRCGSTVFDMFMGTHPAVASLGELNMLGNVLSIGRPCSCGVPLASCVEWGEVFSRVQSARGIALDRHPYDLALWHARARFHVDRARQTAAYERMATLKNAWLRLRLALPAALGDTLPLAPGVSRAVVNKMFLYESIASAWGKPVLVDSSKNALEAIELARRWPQRVRVVLLMRDGRGVYFSHRTTGFERADSVNGWLTYYRRSAPLLRRHVPAAQLMDLRYENFAARPQATADRLCDWLALPRHPEMACMKGRHWHMVAGNETRFAPTKTIHLDERWRTGLVGDEARYFEDRAGGLNRELGYL